MKDKQVMEHRTASKELHLLSCGYEKCAPEHSYGPTVRRYYTLHFILNGSGHFYIDEKHYVLKKAQFFLIPSDIPAFYKADAHDPWTYVWICFNGTSAADMLKHCHASRENPVQPLTCIYANIIKETIFDMMKHPELTPANECYIQSGLYTIFAKLYESANSSYDAFESNDNFYITLARNYIFDNTNPDITVNDVANYLHISRSYLFTLFKKYLNTSPQQFLTMMRIANARELLHSTDIPISIIASSCGYQNPFAFSRAFKREMNMTPSEFRMKYRNLEEIIDY